jgi:hypothetical protein
MSVLWVHTRALAAVNHLSRKTLLPPNSPPFPTRSAHEASPWAYGPASPSLATRQETIATPKRYRTDTNGAVHIVGGAARQSNSRVTSEMQYEMGDSLLRTAVPVLSPRDLHYPRLHQIFHVRPSGSGTLPHRAHVSDPPTVLRITLVTYMRFARPGSRQFPDLWRIGRGVVLCLMRGGRKVQ